MRMKRHLVDEQNCDIETWLWMGHLADLLRNIMKDCWNWYNLTPILTVLMLTTLIENIIITIAWFD